MACRMTRAVASHRNRVLRSLRDCPRQSEWRAGGADSAASTTEKSFWLRSVHSQEDSRSTSPRLTSQKEACATGAAPLRELDGFNKQFPSRNPCRAESSRSSSCFSSNTTMSVRRWRPIAAAIQPPPLHRRSASCSPSSEGTFQIICTSASCAGKAREFEEAFLLECSRNPQSRAVSGQHISISTGPSASNSSEVLCGSTRKAVVAVSLARFIWTEPPGLTATALEWSCDLSESGRPDFLVPKRRLGLVQSSSFSLGLYF